MQERVSSTVTWSIFIVFSCCCHLARCGTGGLPNGRPKKGPKGGKTAMAVPLHCQNDHTFCHILAMLSDTISQLEQVTRGSDIA